SLSTTRARVDDYTHALIEHGQTSTESDIAWVDDLIAAERTRSTKTNGTERGGKERRTSTLRRKEHTS
ncbi:MAG: hypothetical protein ACHQY1_02040, partial [Myxococcota bacterium]